MLPHDWIEVIGFGQECQQSDAVSSVPPIRRHLVSVSPFLVALIVITWLRWCLPGFSIVK